MASTLTVDTIVGATSASKVHVPAHVKNVVSTKFEPVFTFATAAWSNISASGQSLSATITPSSTNSKILIFVTVPIIGNDSSSGVGLALKRDSTLIGQGTSGTSVNAIAVKYSVDVGDYAGTAFHFLDSPSSTSSIVYQVAAWASSGTTCYINRRNGDTYWGAPANITVMEIAQ
jgi:hypothetical protein